MIYDQILVNSLFYTFTISIICFNPLPITLTHCTALFHTATMNSSSPFVPLVITGRESTPSTAKFSWGAAGGRPAPGPRGGGLGVLESGGGKSRVLFEHSEQCLGALEDLKHQQQQCVQPDVIQ